MAQLVIATNVSDEALARILAPWGGNAAAARADVRDYIRAKVRDFESQKVTAEKNAEIQAAIAKWADPFAGA